MSAYVVSSGVTSSGLVLQSGDTLTVLAGGSAYGALIGAGAHEFVASGGMTQSDTVQSGGVLTVSSGGESLLDAVRNGGALVLSSGAQAGHLTVLPGGSAFGGGELDLDGFHPSRDFGLVSGLTLNSGAALLVTGVAENLRVESSFGGYGIDILSGGVGSGLTAVAGGVVLVSAGGQASDLRIAGIQPNYYGDTSELIVQSAGSAADAAISSGAQIVVSSGGSASDISVSSGGRAVIARGGFVSAMQVSSGGELVLDLAVISSGSVLTISGAANSKTTSVSGATISSGGELGYEGLTVLSGGSAALDASAAVFTAVVSSGGRLFGSGVVDGATIFGTVSGVTFAQVDGAPMPYDDIVDDYGTASDVLIGEDFDVHSGGVISGAIVSGGFEDVQSGGLDIGAAVTDGELFVESGGVASGGVISSGGFEQADAGSIITGETVKSGGEIILEALVSNGESLVVGPSPVAKTITFGGATIEAGGAYSVEYAEIESGGILSATSGATTYGSTVESGGRLYGPGALIGFSFDYGVVQGVLISGPGNGLSVGSAGLFGSVSAGGSARAVTVEAEGELALAGAGVAVATTVSSGGLLDDGGVDSAARVLGSGSVTVEFGGVASHDVISAGGRIIVSSGGLDEVTTLSGGSALVYGSSLDTFVSAGGVQTVYAGGVVSAARMVGEARMTISAGGLAAETTVSAGARQTVYGSSFATKVQSGGNETVAADGVADGTAIFLGGTLIDDGIASYATSAASVLAGNVGGSGTLVQDGPGALVLSHAQTFAGQVMISAGTLELAGIGGVGASSINFSGTSGTLQIDAAAMPTTGATFASPLGDFDAAGDELDLASVAFVAGATAAVTGSTLVVSDGGRTYDFSLTGGVASGYQVSQLVAGTLIAPTAAAAASRLIGAAAVFAPQSAGAPGGFAPQPHATGPATLARTARAGR